MEEGGEEEKGGEKEQEGGEGASWSERGLHINQGHWFPFASLFLFFLFFPFLPCGALFDFFLFLSFFSFPFFSLFFFPLFIVRDTRSQITSTKNQ